jgi:hypothetical protein
MHCAVAITSLGSSSSQHSSRIAVLSSEGDLLIVDIEAATGRGGGSVTYVWTIMAHIPVRERPIPSPFICHLKFFIVFSICVFSLIPFYLIQCSLQDPTGNSVPLSPFTVPSNSTRKQVHLSESTVDIYSNLPQRNTVNTANYGSKYDKTEEIHNSDNYQDSTHNLLSQRGLRARDLFPRDGRMCSSGDSLVVLGSDGAARIYYTVDSIGEYLCTCCACVQYVQVLTLHVFRASSY